MSKLVVKCMVLALVASLALFTTPVSGQPASILPLSGMGPYAVGFHIVPLSDASRSERLLTVYIWYPAIAPETPTDQQMKLSKTGWFNATPDLKAAPYPLIVFSPGFGVGALSYVEMLQVLASQGFVVVGLNHPNVTEPVSVVDRPMDILYVINQLADTTQADLSGVIDTNHVGVMGHSFGAYTTLAVTGARIDPVSASTWGDKPKEPGVDTNAHNIWPNWDWEKIAAYRATFSPVKSDEIWPAYTDKRILAAVPLAPCDIPMFGERGLAAATVPTLIIEGTSDPVCLYQEETLFVFKHLGSPERYLLSVVKANHGSFMDAKHLPATSHFYTAFFGYYLRGEKDYAQYLTAKYVDSIEAELKLGLVWGPYTEK
jgi:predicted dienelactone hydrolase